LGYQAGDAVTGSRNVVLGRNADTSTAAGNDQIVIGSTAVGKGNDTFFHNAGNSYNGGNTTTWATTSDARIKKNVVEVSNGLNIINALRPVEFEYKENDKHEVGFIAQEYATVLPNQVKTHDANSAQKEWVDSDGKVFFIQQNLVPYLVKAIQELKAEIDQLKGNV
jgi:hypothetical protein